MGLKDAWNAQMQRHKASVERKNAGIDGSYGITSFVSDGRIVAPGLNRSVAGAVAEFESGAQQSATTLTRVAAGAIIAGPIGAVVGGMFKKDRSRGYVSVTFPEGDVAVIDGPLKDEKKLREFARVITAAGAHYKY